ncbi:hypothetical protein KUTeg_018081 [Tegillarca granosa]|uniref:Uncharacterized protein n=1 Tax=Tegillarca granosa TaxID=220873 RepID=A0ABQ9EMK6_TEGGR|nr:hypothetical protein KUTeg_018081 [Tegillarca granosa]
MRQHHIAPLPGMKASNGSSNIYTTLPEYLTAEIIWKVFPICFIVLGTIVLMKKRNRQLRGSLYLIVLAFADITVLYSGLLREWLLQCQRFRIGFKRDI